MKILITGGAGFLGSTVSDHLLSLGHHVLVIDNLLTGKKDNLNLDHPNLTFLQQDIVDRENLDKAFQTFGPDIVLHAAATYKDPDEWELDIHSNILGTANVVRAAQAAQVKKFLYFQTSLCYGTNPGDEMLTVNSPLDPGSSSYSISKTAAEQYIELSGLNWFSFRLANVYGPRNFSGPVPTFFSRLTEGKPCFVADSRRDFIFVKDLVKFVTATMLEEHKSGRYHISSGGDISIMELYREVEKALAVGPHDIEVRARNIDDAPTILLDPSKTTKEYQLKVDTPLATGIAQAVEYYKANKVEQTYTHLKHEDESASVQSKR